MRKEQDGIKAVANLSCPPAPFFLFTTGREEHTCQSGNTTVLLLPPDAPCSAFAVNVALLFATRRPGWPAHCV